MSDPKTENVASALPGSDVIGEYVADAVIILGSVDIVLCEVDR